MHIRSRELRLSICFSFSASTCTIGCHLVMVIRALSPLNSIHSLINRSGSIATVPQGWTICDGTQGTPDLRNQFILGSGTHLIMKTLDLLRHLIFRCRCTIFTYTDWWFFEPDGNYYGKRHDTDDGANAEPLTQWQYGCRRY
jgi:hypothetical protein